MQWLLHRRMAAQQLMRWSPRDAHLMLKVRTSIVNGTFERGHAVTERWARRPFRARLYEKFRPDDVPYGNEGWGKRAVLDVELIRAAT